MRNSRPCIARPGDIDPHCPMKEAIMHVERKGKMSTAVAAVAGAQQHGFEVVVTDKPTGTADSGEQS